MLWHTLQTYLAVYNCLACRARAWSKVIAAGVPAGVGVGAGVPIGVGVRGGMAVAVGGGVGVAVIAAVGVAAAVGMRVGVAVIPGVAVGVGVAAGVGVARRPQAGSRREKSTNPAMRTTGRELRLFTSYLQEGICYIPDLPLSRFP